MKHLYGRLPTPGFPDIVFLTVGGGGLRFLDINSPPASTVSLGRHDLGGIQADRLRRMFDPGVASPPTPIYRYGQQPRFSLYK